MSYKCSIEKECVPLTTLGSSKCVQNVTSFWSGLPVLATKMLLLTCSVKACVLFFLVLHAEWMRVRIQTCNAKAIKYCFGSIFAYVFEPLIFRGVTFLSEASVVFNIHII